MKITKEYREFANKTLEGFKEQLRQSVAFSCACCQQQKQVDFAAIGFAITETSV